MTVALSVPEIGMWTCMLALDVRFLMLSYSPDCVYRNIFVECILLKYCFFFFLGDLPPLILSPSQYHNYTQPKGNFVPYANEEQPEYR